MFDVLDKIVSYDTAILAKANKFDKACLNYYLEKDKLKEAISLTYNNLHRNYYRGGDYERNGVSAPTQSQLQKWLREEHNINICICVYSFIDKTYQYVIDTDKYRIASSQYLDKRIIGDYEYVLEKALQRALKLIQIK